MRDYERLRRGILGVETMAHILLVLGLGFRVSTQVQNRVSAKGLKAEVPTRWTHEVEKPPTLRGLCWGFLLV